MVGSDMIGRLLVDERKNERRALSTRRVAFNTSVTSARVRHGARALFVT